MFFVTFCKIISALLAIVGVTFLIPLGFALYFGETAVYLPLLIPMAASIALMLLINLPTRRLKMRMSIRQTFVIVAAAWLAISLMGAFPLYFSGSFPSFTDAFFESVSGFSTTGATVCADVESLPHSINLFRCLMHWLGGMGVVTLTVALLPLLGVGGFQLIKAETTGPEKGKVTAKITTTAKVLWLIYAGMTIVQAILLRIAGMSTVDALSHAFSTLGTGGFSSKNSSIGSYNSVSIDFICMIFMLLAGINFSLFYYIIIGKFRDILENSELKAYIGIVVFFSLAVSICSIPFFGGWGKSLRYGAFHVLALLTTTGFGTSDFTLWPLPAQFFLFCLFFIGGSSGSTGGGIKVIRWVILFKQVNNEAKRMLHPHGVFSIRLNNRAGRKDVVFNVTAFMVVYFMLVAATVFAGTVGGLDLLSAASGALSMVGNIGPGFGLLGPSNTLGFLPAGLKWWYCFAMLAGRLELYTMIIFFLPSYWKK